MRRIAVAAVVITLLCGSSIAALAAPASHDAFQGLAQKFIEDDLHASPEMATDNGDHRYDSRLTDLSRASIQRRIEATKKWKHAFEAFAPDHLAAEDEADREWLIAQLDGR